MSKYGTEAQREQLLQSLSIADTIALGELAMIPEGGAAINIAVLATYTNGLREHFDLAQLLDAGQTLYEWGVENYNALSTAIEDGTLLTAEIVGDGQWRYSNLGTLVKNDDGTYTSTYPTALVAGAISFPLVDAEEIVRFP